MAVLTDHSPASVADPFWPLVHGEERVPLPALPDLVDLLRARGREPQVEVVDRSPRTFDSVPALTAFLRRQLFIAEDGDKDVHFRAILPDHIVRRDGGWTLAERPAGSVGVVTWSVDRGLIRAGIARRWTTLCATRRNRAEIPRFHGPIRPSTH